MKQLSVMEKVDKFYGGEPPEWVVKHRKTFVMVRFPAWSETKVSRITLKDLVYYYAHDARNITSGMRTLAGISGDWRPIDNLAKHCLEWFKFVNRKGLEKEAKQYGMQLR